MDFGFDATTEDYRKRLLAFMDEHVYPAEAGWRPEGWEPPPVLARLQAAARDAGLWNLFRTLTNVQYWTVQDLAITGARTARDMYGAGGWMAHHNTDRWRATAPIDGPQWGLWPTGGAWLTQHLWWRWEYGGSRPFLRDNLVSHRYRRARGCRARYR